MDERGRKFGIRFGPQPLMSNSREALAGGEFAKEQGQYEAYHEAVFKAFFTECRDIGNREVVLGLAGKIGLDEKALNKALEKGTYLPRLEAATRAARARGIGSAPTFLMEGYGVIVGAQPFKTFRTALYRLQSSGAKWQPTEGQRVCIYKS